MDFHLILPWLKPANRSPAAGQQALVSRKRALMARQIAERTLIVFVNLACPGIRECSLLHYGNDKRRQQLGTLTLRNGRDRVS